MKLLLAAVALATGLATGHAQTDGPYSVQQQLHDVSTLDSSSQRVMVFSPVSLTNETFPLISCNHGAAGGGIAIIGYQQVFSTMASRKFINAPLLSCAFF